MNRPEPRDSGPRDSEPEPDDWPMHERLLIMWDRASVRWLVVLLTCGAMLAVVLVTRSAPQEQVVSQIVSSGQPMNGQPMNGQPMNGEPIPSGASANSWPNAAASSSANPSISSQPAMVVVDVTGPVRRPGIVKLPSGSRVADAIAAAGGIVRGRAGVNLARVLVDGEQIVVGSVALQTNPSDASGSGASGATSQSPSSSGAGAPKVRLNSATASELEALPRVGPVTAAKIVEYRNQHGGFRSVDQLRDVSGIGDVTFAGIAPLVEL